MVRLPVYTPMLAQAGTLTSVQGPGWAVEMKWDGVRALAYVEDGAVRLMSRNAKDITPPPTPSSSSWPAPPAATTRSSTGRSSPSTTRGGPASRPCSPACTSATRPPWPR
ncbi:hypothetical protein [Nonomuraea salmonea]|uniref:ATP-dependent DNA ligase n=1 Tax=Nonomuraea salmonea TaxID=46181 RepID=UPI0031EE2B2D